MSLVRVAIPVLRGKRQFHLLKGRPWSSVEHLILQAVSESPSTVQALVDRSALPRRVVLEILIRLMRVGWVEMATQREDLLFRATEVGKKRSSSDELPAVTKSATRWIGFFIDRITSSPFRSREFQAFPKARVEARTHGDKLIWLTPPSAQADPDPREFLSALTDEDEQIIGVEPSYERLSELHALVTVRNGKIEGLPTRASQALIQAIMKAASVDTESSAVIPAATSAGVPLASVTEPAALQMRKGSFSLSDVILGGPQHSDALSNAVRRARSRLIIHSTFVDEDKFRALLPALKQAVGRGVRVDILCGQGENSAGYKETQELINRVRDELAAMGLDTAIRFHPHSTNSHSKIVVADDLSEGRFSAVVGSCNWLSSSFVSFDASIRVRDPLVVSDVLLAIAKLARSNGNWNQTTLDLAAIALDSSKKSALGGMKVPMALVFGADHGILVRTARDEANTRIFVASHRISEVANRAIVLPAIAAAQGERHVESKIYFNRSSGILTQEQAKDLVLRAGQQNVQLNAVHDPRLHAKILAWDDDAAVVTSLNWLSADTSPDNSLQEIGVFVGGGRVADHIVRVFENSRID